MQVLDKPKTTSRTLLSKRRRRFLFPVVCTLAVIGVIFTVKTHGASGLLISCGVLGVLTAASTVVRMDSRLWLIPKRIRHSLIGLWLIITLGLCASLVFSGIRYLSGGQLGAELAYIEARRTVVAAILFVIWLIGASVTRRVGVFRIILWTLAVFEAIRLMALGLHPTVFSYIVWPAALATTAFRNPALNNRRFRVKR